MTSNAVFFGVTRFSLFLPSSNAWNLTSDEEKYKAKLFSPERLQPRFDVFFKYALPIYKKYANEFQYQHILLYSAHMPSIWKEKLFNELMEFPFVKPCEVDDTISYMGVMDSYLQETCKIDTPVALFRVDDDDILSADYMRKLSSYADFPFEGMSVSFSKAVGAYFSDGRFVSFKKVHKPMLSMGLATIGRYDSLTKKLIMPRAVNHAETDKHRPVIVDGTIPAFVWTHHATQDSNQDKKGASDRLSDELVRLPSIVNRGELNSFPTLLPDFDDLESQWKTLFVSENQKFDSQLMCGPIELSPGTKLRFTISATLQNSISNSRALLVGLGQDAFDISFVEGMMKSQDPSIGWFRYVGANEGKVESSFEISLGSDLSLTTVAMRIWQVNPGGNVKCFKVERKASF
jgi:hypothetical protein